MGFLLVINELISTNAAEMVLVDMEGEKNEDRV